jgi:hypothetical protein
MAGVLHSRPFAYSPRDAALGRARTPADRCAAFDLLGGCLRVAPRLIHGTLGRREVACMTCT